MDAQELTGAYCSLLMAFVDSQDEHYLAQAADLGRQLVLADTPPEEIAEIHENAITRLADEYPDKTLLESAKRISAPLMELLMAYGLAFRERSEERERFVAALRESEEKYRSIFQAAASVIMSVDPRGVIVECNARVAELLGYEREQMLGRRFAALIHPDDAAAFQETVKVILGGTPQYGLEYRMIKEDGTTIYVSLDCAARQDREGKPVNVVSVITDVTGRKRAEEAVAKKNRLTRVLLDNLPCVAMLVRYDSREIVAVNAAASETGAAVGELCHMFSGHQEEPCPGCLLPAMQETGEPQSLEVERAGVVWDVHWTPVDDDIFLHYCFDITGQKRLEEQFRQSQKLEAVGRLAGGVAHDFNNILTGIKGYTQFALKEMEEGRSREDLSESLALAERATGLTRQLLAFSRRQTLRPVVLNINALISDLTKMLRRLIGEDIDLQFTPGSDAHNIKADPGQIEQVLMNLAVNARDAMPLGGRLTIETSNAALTEAYADAHVGVKPGQYTMIAVTDSGCGMDEATQSRVFEPFFTTKEIGKGTGLGLSTVYGIVKQHDGNIWIYSELGEGTTIKIYLPSVIEQAEDVAAKVEQEPAPGGTETILLVEDEPAVLAVAERMLRPLGYTVLSAPSPSKVAEALSGHGGKIDLLLTDVIMPGSSGRALFDRLSADQPDLKVLYISGYTDAAIVHHGVLERGTAFLGKPFSAGELARKVREALDS